MASDLSLSSPAGVTTRQILATAEVLASGGLAAFPTETVYGLGADATTPAAVAQIYAIKGRPQFNPLISHVASIDAAIAEGEFPPLALRLAQAFWPGPLTLVLPRRAGGNVCDLACAGLATVGLRVPAHPVALALLRAFGRPVAAPSANRSGRISPASAADVRAEFQDMVPILDGGACAVGVESTILACLNGRVSLLRPGGIAREEVEAIAGLTLDAPAPGIHAPGMLASHYAPNAGIRLGATDLRPGEIGLGFAGTLDGARRDLSPRGDLNEAAANLYGFLRALDAEGAGTIAVAAIPGHGLGAAINDRLRRAAAPRT